MRTSGSLVSPSAPQASLALLQSIFDGAPDAIVIVDGEGRIVLGNAAAVVLFGYETAELCGMSVDALVPESVRPHHGAQRAEFDRHPANRAMGAGRHLTALRKDGRLVPVDISLTRVDLAEGNFVIAIARDVAIYGRFLEACPIAIFVTENDRVTYANPAALALVGVSDCRGLECQRLVELVHPEDQASIESWMTNAADTGAHAIRPAVEERIVRTDAEVRYVETTSVLVPNAAVPTFLSAMQDVTERRRAFERARCLEGALQQQQRLADIGAVTTRIVHDIANPVAGLIMGTQRALQLLDRLPADLAGPIRPNVDRVLMTARHLETLLQEFKDFSRLQRLELQGVALAPFFAEVEAAWTSEATARYVRLRIDGVPRVTVRADRLKLRRVFDNLVKNALEAIDHGPGTVDITVAKREPNSVRITVADSGPGIPADRDPFALFETTKPNGTGLGLASVRQIISAHGGTIELQRGSASGAVFTIDLLLPPA
jgi:PAS domain S-box-containing protein